MNTDNSNNSVLMAKIDRLMNEVLNLAHQSEEDTMVLVTILRKLEFIHRQIREELFEPSLPNTRHDLYSLLKDIDETGGWPYIERMRLRNICEKFLQASENVEQGE